MGAEVVGALRHRPFVQRAERRDLGGIQIPWLSFAAFMAIVILLFVYLRWTCS